MLNHMEALVISSIVSSTVVFACCLLVVLSRQFADSLLQRIALSGLSICALGVAIRVYKTDYVSEVMAGFLVFSAMYCLASIIKNRDKIFKGHFQ